ncbi:MAG: hypothetical protein ACLPZR_03840 [Solirubrobacteraceae bacterium]
MTDDTVERLRRLNPVPGEVPAPPIETVMQLRALESSSPVARRRRPVGLGAVMPALSTVLAIAIAATAVLTLTHRSEQPSGRTSSAVPAAAKQLVSELAVLRRPQTAADLNSPALQRFLRNDRIPIRALRGTPIRSLIRLAAITPFGKVFLIPFLPPTKTAIAKLPAPLRRLAAYQIAHQGHLATLGLLAAGGASGGFTPASLETEGAGISGGSSPTEVVLVIPDGVVKITVLLPRQRIPGERLYKHSLSITVAVHDNIAAFQVDRYADAVGTENMIWYGPTGNVVRRIGNTRNLNRVIPGPKPSPPTELSRRAQRNPATPNPVFVTPAAGGPHTTFTITFRLLLTGKSYQYIVTGPGGPGCRGTIRYGGGGGIGGGPTDVRGQIWTEPFSPGTNGAGPNVTEWCPGTFHVSVSTIDTPGNGRIYAPFGTVTFEVRR